MTFLITGMQHSGTTFAANFARACGRDLGPDNDIFLRGNTQGEEWDPLRLALKGSAAIATGGDLGETNWATPVNPEKLSAATEWLRNDRFPKMPEVPEVIKVPGGHIAPALPVLRPTKTYVMVRDPQMWLKSIKKNSEDAGRLDDVTLYDRYLQGIGSIIATLVTEGLDYTIVDFPRAAQDRNYCVKSFLLLADGDELVASKAFDEVANPDLINRALKPEAA